MESRKIRLINQDPADRFIAATAKCYNIPLITSDKKIIDSKALDIIENKI